MPFGLRTDLESCYLIGPFGTRICGRQTEIIPLPEKLAFGNVAEQGLAFYGGNIEYKFSVNLEEKKDVKITATEYRGAVIKVLVDGKESGYIAFPPFTLTLRDLDAGKHEITLVLNGTRYNTFSALHNLYSYKKRNYIGPDYWRTENQAWSYEYFVRPMGILKTPIVEIIEKKN